MPHVEAEVGVSRGSYATLTHRLHGPIEEWMAEVLSHLPADDSALSAARFLQHAEVLAHQYPNASVLKFAAKALLGREDHAQSSSIVVVDELVRIAQFHPHLLPILSRENAKLGKHVPVSERERLGALMHDQVLQAARRAETDSVLWILFILRKQLRRPLRLRKRELNSLLELDDDLVWIALSALVPSARTRVMERVKSVPYIDETDRESHWLSRYELWRTGHLLNTDCSEPELLWMKTLQRHGVSFLAI